MPKSREAIEAEHAIICRMRASGLTFQRIADILGMNVNTIKAIVRRDRLRSEGAAPKRTDRPEKLTPRDERALLRSAYHNRWGTLGDIIAGSGLDICESTATKYLRKAGISQRYAVESDSVGQAPKGKSG